MNPSKPQFHENDASNPAHTRVSWNYAGTDIPRKTARQNPVKQHLHEAHGIDEPLMEPSALHRRLHKDLQPVPFSDTPESASFRMRSFAIGIGEAHKTGKAITSTEGLSSDPVYYDHSDNSGLDQSLA
jgi:hypothetical protein